MRVLEVVPGLFIGTKLVPPAGYESLGVDAIVDLEGWDVAWNPPVPTGCLLVHCTEGLNRSGVVVARALLELGWTAADAIERVRTRRGLTDDGIRALSNSAFVDWLVAEEEARRVS